MKKQSEGPAILFLLLRLFICLWLGWTALNVWGIGGRIVDWYTDETVLSLARESFWCNEGLWIAMGLAGILILWDMVKICRYVIVKYLLEKPCRLRFGPWTAVVWVTFLAVGAGLVFQGWRLMAPYERAIDDYLAGGEGREESEVPYPPEPIYRKIPDEPIVSIQINTIKDYPAAGTEDFQAFLDGLSGLEKVDPLEQQDMVRGEEDLAVTLRYEGEKRATLLFFQPEAEAEQWYVETEDGTIFEGGDFIEDYVNVARTEPEGSEESAAGELLFEPEKIQQYVNLNRLLADLGVSCSTQDMRAFLAMETLDQMELWDTQEEALQAAREELAWRMQQYRYAVQEGYALTEEELDERMAERDAMIMAAPNFSDLEAAFEECGSSYEEYQQAVREEYRITCTIEKLYDAVYEEFRHGNDRIGDTVCGDVAEYWSCYLAGIVYPATEDWKETTLVPMLEEAEKFCVSLDWQELNQTSQETGFSFAELKNLQFCFSSGAGAWSTLLTIREDGSFSGEYHDSDMGVAGDNFPNGTCYKCNFYGRFTQPVEVNTYTYSVKIAEIAYEKEAGTEEIIDGIRYCYESAYGLENAENILIYLPGAPLDELPEEFRSWIGYYDLSRTTETELPFYALNNEAQQQGFTSYDIGESIQNRLTYMEEQSDALERDIQENASLTQADLNVKSQELYDMWDSMLNEVWETLKQTQDAETMEKLNVQEREWIAWKERQIREAGEEFEGGSLQPMVCAQKAAELTRERVYELIAVLDPE